MHAAAPAERLDELGAFLDELLGAATTEYRLRGRFHGVLIDITFDPLTYARRMIKESLQEALPETWIYRAAAVQDAAPRSGDFHGQATQDELRDATNRCHAVKRACLRHADLLAEGDPWTAFEMERDELVAELEAIPS